MVLKVERGAELEIAKLLPSACLINGIVARAWLPRLDKKQKNGVQRQILLLRGFVFVQLSDWAFAIRIKGLLNRVTGFLSQIGRTTVPQLISHEIVERFRVAIEEPDLVEPPVLEAPQADSSPAVGSKVWLLDRSIEAVVKSSSKLNSIVTLNFLGRMIDASVENKNLVAA